MLTDRACGASYSAYCLRVTGSDAIVRISDQAVNRQGPSSSLSTPTTSRHSSLTTRTLTLTLAIQIQDPRIDIATHSLDGAPRTRRQTQSPRYLGALRPICPFGECLDPPPGLQPTDEHHRAKQHTHESDTPPTPPTPQPQNARMATHLAFSQAKMNALRVCQPL